MWAAGLVGGAAEGRACAHQGLGPRCAPCVVRPVSARRRRRRCRATSGSVQRVCLQRAGRAGGEGAGAGAAAGWAGGGERGALARPCLPLSASAETAPARTVLGAERPGAAEPLPASAPPELRELLDRAEPSRGLEPGLSGETLLPLGPSWSGVHRCPRPSSLPLLAPPPSVDFFKRCGRQRCGAKFLEGARMY